MPVTDGLFLNGSEYPMPDCAMLAIVASMAQDAARVAAETLLGISFEERLR